MRNLDALRLSAVSLLALVAGSLPISAQELSWSRIGPFGGPNSPSHSILTTDSGGTVYANDINGWSIRSTDLGESWEILPYGLSDMRAAGRDTAYATIRTVSMQRTTDGGATWQQYLDFFPSSFLPLDGGGMLAVSALGTDATLRQKDGSGVISDVTNRLPVGFRLLAVGGDGAIIARGVDTMFRSTNGGVDWTSVSPGAQVRGTLFIGRAPSGTLIHFDDSARVLRSTDDGASWTPVDLPLVNSVGGNRYPAAAAIDASGAIVASSIGGTIRSSDEGATWEEVDDRFFYPIGAAGSVLLARAAGIFHRSSDGGRTWTAARGVGLPGGQVSRVAAVRDTAIFASVQGYRYSWRASDGGSWRSFLDPSLDGSLLRQRGGILVTYSSSKRRLFTSSDFGATWDSSEASGPMIQRALLSTDHSGAIILGGPSTWRSTDRGDTWQPLDTTKATGGAFGDIVLDSTGRLLSFKPRTLSYYDETSGRWTELPTSPPLPNGATALVVMPDRTIVIGTYNEGIFHSTDNGLTWQHTAAPSGNVEEIVAGPSGTLVALATGQPLFLSRDRGATWRSISSAIPYPVTAVDISPNGRVFAGTWIGVYRSDETVLGVETDERHARALGASITHGADGRAATLTLRLERSTPVSLTLVTATGETLGTQHLGTLDAGSNRIPLDLDDAPAGACFVRVAAGSIVEAIPVVVR